MFAFCLPVTSQCSSHMTHAYQRNYRLYTSMPHGWVVSNPPASSEMNVKHKKDMYLGKTSKVNYHRVKCVKPKERKLMKLLFISRKLFYFLWFSPPLYYHCHCYTTTTTINNNKTTTLQLLLIQLLLNANINTNYITPRKCY